MKPIKYFTWWNDWLAFWCFLSNFNILLFKPIIAQARQTGSPFFAILNDFLLGVACLEHSIFLGLPAFVKIQLSKSACCSFDSWIEKPNSEDNCGWLPDSFELLWLCQIAIIVLIILLFQVWSANMLKMLWAPCFYVWAFQLRNILMLT